MKQGQPHTPNELPARAAEKPGTSTRQFSGLELRQIFEGGPDTDPLTEIERIFAAIMPESGRNFVKKVHHDLTAIFSGRFQGFRESFVKYHDLRHTRNVTLATIRLFHGLHCESIVLPPDVIKLCIICSYFHDTGMLLTVKDAEHSGAAYLKCHEERSIAFARKYMHDHGFPIAYMDNCEAIINCTNLTLEPEDINFESEEIQLAGHVLGSADILAQMADRYYLECLPLLFNEQQDAGIQQHPSSIALMRQTTGFYHEVIEKRLHKTFNNRLTAMRTHFRKWWGVDSNLYLEYINKNISYLEDVVRKHDRGEGEMDLYLRRRQPKA
jgi:hypothetical protein